MVIPPQSPLSLDEAVDEIIKIIVRVPLANDALNAMSISLGSFVASIDGDHDMILEETYKHTKQIAAKISAKGEELAQAEAKPLVSLE